MKKTARKQQVNHKKTRILLIATLAIITFAVFAPSLKNDFVNWDDPQYVVENNLIKNISIDNLSKFGENVAGNFHPLTMISYALDYRFFKLDPFYYHLKNLIFHLLNTLLVFLLILKVSKHNLLVAFFTAIVFGIHPMHVESVVWISERKDVLYTFYFLIGLLLYYKYLDTRRTVFYILASVSFVFSVLAKSAAVVFPVVLFIIDYYEYGKLKYRQLLEKIPLLAISILFGIIALKTQTNALGNVNSLSLFERIQLASYGFINYLVKFIYPHKLTCLHPYFDFGDHSNLIILSVASVFLILTLMVVYRNKFRWFFFGIAFYIITIALVLQFFQFGNSLISERYTYMPYVGIGFVFFYFVDLMIKKYHKSRFLIYGIITIQLMVFAWLANQQTKIWKDSVTLWTNAIKKYPKSSFIAYNNRASKYVELDQFDKAVFDYNKCLNIRPTYDLALKGRGRIYFKQKKYTQAINDLTVYLKIHPEDLEELSIRALCYFQSNQFDKALSDYDLAIQKNPNNGTYYQGRAFVNIKLGNTQNALKDILKAKELGTAVNEKIIAALQTK